MLDPIVDLALALTLGWVMAEAGSHKLRAPLWAGAAIDAYRVLPEGAGRWLARPLGGVELILAGALLVPAVDIGAALGTAALLGAYFAAMALNLVRGRRSIDCGCGGPDSRQPISAALLVRNAVLVVSALLLAGGSTARSTTWLDMTVAVAAAAVAILCYASVNQLLANSHRPMRAR